MNYYPFHIGDYAAHTRYLTLMEDLAYRRMLDLYYVSEKPLEPAEQTARLIGMRDHVAEVGTILSDFFEATEAGFINKRANEELDKFSLMKQGGRDGAAKRWGKGGDREAIAPPSPPQSPPNSNQNQNQNQRKESTSDASRPTPARKKVSLPSDFAVSPRVSAWAIEKGFDRLPDHLDAFRRKAEMNAYRYADWDLAFMEAVREDWAKLRGNGRSGPAPIAVPDGTIKCETCGTRTRQFTGRQCDPCWRGVVNPRVAA
jgi:uncharacterized protein YdaU (DUF1376 family)